MFILFMAVFVFDLFVVTLRRILLRKAIAPLRYAIVEPTEVSSSPSRDINKNWRQSKRTAANFYGDPTENKSLLARFTRCASSYIV